MDYMEDSPVACRDGKDVHVMLSYRPLGLVRAVTKDICTDGLRVDTGIIRLPRHSEVEVTLSFRCQSRQWVLRVPARVTGSSVGGTHLAFHDCEPSTAQALQRIVNSH